LSEAVEKKWKRGLYEKKMRASFFNAQVAEKRQLRAGRVYKSRNGLQKEALHHVSDRGKNETP